MKNATKKWLIVAGGLAACAALVFIIAGQFEKKPVNDTLPPPSCSSQGGVAAVVFATALPSAWGYSRCAACGHRRRGL